jgi:hypothetical protein
VLFKWKIYYSQKDGPSKGMSIHKSLRKFIFHFPLSGIQPKGLLNYVINGKGLLNKGIAKSKINSEIALEEKFYTS